ncbi:kinesin-like protein KIN-7B isoform X5 [Prosopis cineraria]|uniref:kinesin-like protein KIN-7B isoform X5 n=1 Tax=Prosopis cineraria TaxID=364024 RepID=UPI00240FE5E0|nr:kinesin-like protein KIN-7B isoform X5 [Prosopis cineraria]
MVGTPATPLSKIQQNFSSTPGGPKVREEKILVTVRMRPLNRKEQAMYELIAWDCLDEQTIVFKNPNQERPGTAYTFDKVFAPASSTQKVYEHGARDVALSVVSGINATIFAYGQTSSGKTYTMRGIIENVIQDIYKFFEKTPARDFILRASAMEIYNEMVIDLLNRESGPLRLLDDPEKGTVVEKLTEEVARDGQHLRHLIGICEAQRQVGETALNDKSSRSHQIIRLTIESSLRESSGRLKSYLASLNLVDLAGSERISQTKTSGARLKEGSHINRSLLTLTTVIRKLSGGERGHIPYRSSKLTRILQSSLGGNARTAIICAISPALSHVDQTRNTLTFATSAKDVINNAQVNMMESEMEELRRQLAQSQFELERRNKGLNQNEPSSQVVRCLSFPVDNESNPDEHPQERREAVGRHAILKKLLASPDPSILVTEIRKLENRQLRLCEDANRALQNLHKDFATHKFGNQETAEALSKVLSEIKDMLAASSTPENIVVADKANLMEEISRLKSQRGTISSLERKLENVQKSFDKLVLSFPSTAGTPENKTQLKTKKILPFSLSNSPNVQHIIRAPCSPLSSSSRVTEHETENKAPEKDISPRSSDTRLRSHTGVFFSQEGSPAMQQSKSMNVKKIQRMFKNAVEENIRSFRIYVTELKELVAKLHYQKQLLVCQVLELEANNFVNEVDTCARSSMPRHILFEENRKQIVMLWHLCHISIVHRTQFYLLLRGDPSDHTYLEVELRRLTWLEQHLAELGNASPALLGDEPAGSVSASIKALKQEREYLAKRVNSKLTAEERELLYAKWEVPAVGKQRRLQLVNKLWTDPYNMEHVQESAEIVAKLIDFCGTGENLSKDMFELNFASPSDKKTWAGWNFISNLLNL